VASLKLYAGKPHVQFGRRTVASVRATLCATSDPTMERRGPHAVYLSNVREFTLRDFTIKDSSNYAILIVGSQHGTIAGIKAYGGWDGIHMRYTRDVTISDCRLYTGDDSLAGWMWQNVTVTNCILSSACHPMRVGGENIVFSDILVTGPSRYPHPPSDKYNTMSAIVHIGARPTAEGAGLDELLTSRPSDNMIFSGITMLNVRSPMYMGSSACCRWPDGVLSAGLKNLRVPKSEGGRLMLPSWFLRFWTGQAGLG
jgi:hypothetical protein